MKELICEDASEQRKRGRASKLLQHRGHLARISTLPKPSQRALIDVIEAWLAQQGR